jgi:hypothetical protein|tara:strand:- start:278 stop:775 length:498 start_codon:yes stop_codon:yes gene_type:complete
MAIGSVLTNTFKEELLQSGHNFNASGDTPAGDAFKIALYSATTANIGTTTTVYTAPADGTADPTNTLEVTSTGSGYTTGGNALTNTGTDKSTVTAYTDFSDTSWTSASFTARGCMIYNTDVLSGFTTNRSVCTIDFGGDKTVSSGTFTIQFPTNDSSDAIIRITS